MGRFVRYHSVTVTVTSISCCHRFPHFLGRNHCRFDSHSHSLFRNPFVSLNVSLLVQMIQRYETTKMTKVTLFIVRNPHMCLRTVSFHCVFECHLEHWGSCLRCFICCRFKSLSHTSRVVLIETDGVNQMQSGALLFKYTVLLRVLLTVKFHRRHSGHYRVTSSNCQTNFCGVLCLGGGVY
jgi:hypothetical protein